MSTGHQGGSWMNEEQREATREQAAASAQLCDELECFVRASTSAGGWDFMSDPKFYYAGEWHTLPVKATELNDRDPEYLATLINRYAACVCFEWWFDQQNVGKWVGGEFEYTHAPGLCHQMMLKASAFRKKYGAR